jgi:hypothetical protein
MDVNYIGDVREFTLHRTKSMMWGNCCTGQTDEEIEKLFTKSIGLKTPSTFCSPVAASFD